MDDTQYPWLSTKKAAKYLDMHPDTLRTLYRSGEIKARKPGKAWRTKKEWLDAYLMGRSAA